MRTRPRSDRRGAWSGAAGIALVLAAGVYWSWTGSDGGARTPADHGVEVQQLPPVVSSDIADGGGGPSGGGLQVPAQAGTPARRMSPVPDTSDIPLGG